MGTNTPSKRRGPGALSKEHKAALAEGRAQGRAVRNYLEALEAHKPKRGRRRTRESIEKRLAKLRDEIPEADPTRRVQLIQERLDLENELETIDNKVDLSDLETGFVKAAKQYSDRKGISYAAWRELGVTPSVLQAAGIRRTRG